METIAERLLNRRRELHLTLEDISRKTGLPKSTIQRWESGAVKNMGADNLLKVAEALDTTVTMLQTGKPYNSDRFMPSDLALEKVFAYFAGRAEISCITEEDGERYFPDSSNTRRFTMVNDRAANEIMNEMTRYFRFLLYERSVYQEDYSDQVG